jgi:DNA-directed RNA polymerase specialized sigma24 family protein
LGFDTARDAVRVGIEERQEWTMNTTTHAWQPPEDVDARRQAVGEGPRDGGNQPAFGAREWFDSVYPPLLGYLKSFAAHWADDGASVALLRFQEKGPHSSPIGVQIVWLRRTGHHWIVNQLRSRWERDGVPLPLDRVGPDVGGDDLHDVVRDGLARFLRRLRRRLPKELDELIRLRFDLGMTLQQITNQLFGEWATNARRLRVMRRIKKALALLRRGLQQAGLDAIPCEREGLRNLIQGLPEAQIKVLELFYETDLSDEEIGERVCPEVAPAGRGLRARRLHRIALVHLLRRYSRSLGGHESRPGLRGPGRAISRDCGEKKSWESVLIWEGGAESRLEPIRPSLIPLIPLLPSVPDPLGDP